MVTKTLRWIVMTGLLVVLAAGCAPKAQVKVAPGFKPAPEADVIYIVPFESILVPESFATAAFNDFVDDLNEVRKQAGLSAFVILKQDIKEIDPAWLARQVYIKGEIWGYVQNSGCCSTELKAKGRVHLFEPGKKEPTLDVMVPVETFFEHDKAALPQEQVKLAASLARQLSTQIMTRMPRK